VKIIRRVQIFITAVLVAGAAAGLLGGCASLERFLPERFGSGGADAEGADVSGVSGRSGKQAKVPPFENSYTRDDCVRALVQLNDLRESAGHFSDYIWGDVLFEDYLASIIWLEKEPLDAGTGVSLSFYDEQGRTYHTITRGWAAVDAGGNSVWKMDHTLPDLQFICEVLTGPDRIPRTVFVKNMKTGETIKRDSFYMDMLAGSVPGPQPAMDTRSGTVRSADAGTQPDYASQQQADTLETSGGAGSWFEQIRQQEYESKITTVYAAMDILGEEAIRVAGRWVRSVKLSSGPESNRDTLVAWFSPDVSGKVLRVALGDGRILAEVVEFNNNLKTSLFSQ